MTRFLRKVRHWWSQTIAYSVFFWKHENHDWDYSYLINLIRFKLTRMADTIEKNEIIEGNRRVAKQIRYAVFLIDRYQSDYYLDQLRAEFFRKWGSPVYSWVGEGDDLYRSITKYPNARTEEERLQAEGELLELIHRASDYDEQILDRLFRHVRKNFRNWWD